MLDGEEKRRTRLRLFGGKGAAECQAGFMNSSVDLWPHRLFWTGDPRAVAIFSVKGPRHEPGPWLGTGGWRPWRHRSISTKRLDLWLRNNKPPLRGDAFATINRFYGWRRAQE